MKYPLSDKRQAGFVPDVLRATPPELLVGLLQQCVRPHMGGKGNSRGFKGRTNPANGFASGAAAQDFVVDGLQGAGWVVSVSLLFASGLWAL